MALLVWLLLPLGSSCLGATLDIHGQWFQASDGWRYGGEASLQSPALRKVNGVSLTGGRFLLQADFSVSESGRYVLDFKNTSILGHFRHFVFDKEHRLIASLQGGIQREADNPFFLRHGREVDLPAGQYRLITELDGPYYLAQPEPYLDDLGHYRDAVKPGNALALIGIGVFLGLGIYYAALSLARHRMAEGMYALFILGNLLFNGGSLLLFSDLLGLHWIYMASVPILFSNCAYITFVMALLEIRRDTHPGLFRAGMAMLMVLVVFLLLAAARPNWSLELARYGVGVFLSYGLTAGIIRARQGNVSARWYLVAIAVFFVLGSTTISLGQMAGIHTLYVEHMGLLSVAVEVILLALVLAYQFGQVHREREHALVNLEHSKRMACTDALTGLANRFALDVELAALPSSASLTYLDLDNLKYYNDTYGHERGDDLLRSFAQHLAAAVDNWAGLYRVGGDEFAIVSADGNVGYIQEAIAETATYIQSSGFELAGVSAGTAHVWESNSLPELKRLADVRMYEAKRKAKLGHELRS
jgi:diguanylate cyclase (GGDEF)-like protein